MTGYWGDTDWGDSQFTGEQCSFCIPQLYLYLIKHVLNKLNVFANQRLQVLKYIRFLNRSTLDMRYTLAMRGVEDKG